MKNYARGEEEEEGRSKQEKSNINDEDETTQSSIERTS